MALEREDDQPAQRRKGFRSGSGRKILAVGNMRVALVNSRTGGSRIRSARADLGNFGALIIDTYDYDDERIAFEKVRNVAMHHPVILLSSESPLFQRISAARSQFPLLEIIQRQVAAEGEPLNALKPTKHYGQTPIREEWRSIRSVLERTKTATNSGNAIIGGEITRAVCKKMKENWSLVLVRVGRLWRSPGDDLPALCAFCICSRVGKLTLLFECTEILNLRLCAVGLQVIDPMHLKIFDFKRQYFRLSFQPCDKECTGWKAVCE